MVALAVGLAAYTTFYGQPMAAALYIEATPLWGEVLSVLLWAAVGTGLVYIYGSYLLAIERVDLINWLGGGALLLNVGINYALIPTLGALGAAAATVATHTALAGAEYLLCRRAVERSEASTRWWPLPLYVLLVLATAYTLHLLGVHWLIALGLQAAACLGAGIFTGLIIDPKILLASLAAKVKP